MGLRPLGGGGGTATLFALKNEDTTVNNSTDVIDDPELTLPVEANSVYILDAYLLIDGSSTADIKASLSAPSGTSYRITLDGPASTVSNGSGSIARTTTTGSSLGLGAMGAGSAVAATPRGTIRTGSTAGSVAIRWAQTVAEVADTKLRADSWMRLTKIA